MIPSTNRTTSNSNVDLSIIKLEAQRKLLKLLSKFEGTKTIIWDDKLIGPFEFVASASLLRKHDATRLFRLSDVRASFTTNTDYTLFFLRKDYQAAKAVADILHRADRLFLAKTSLVLMPQRCSGFEKLLEQNKVDLEKLNSIEELAIEFFVLDTDVLSLENEFVYRDMYLNDDYSAIHQIVEGLLKLQNIYGQIPRISGQGKGAKLVCDLLLRRRKLQPRSGSHRLAPSQIQQLVIIDRRIDLVTPLLTQLTYEGLLDEVFGINSGTITLPSEKFRKQDEAKGQKDEIPPEKLKETKRFELRSSEELYAKLRDCHINAVADVLKQSARTLQADYDECNSEGKTIHEMGKIVKRLNHLKIAKNSQSNHVTIAELVNGETLKAEFILGLRIEHELLQEDKINRIIPNIETKLWRQENPLHVLRLICAQSILNNGIKPKICNDYKREIIQNYGEDYLVLLLQLERANLLLSREKYYESGGFSSFKSRFGLINDNVNEYNPNHFSYVYGGYAPLSVMVAKTLAQSTQGPLWRSMSENFKYLPEPTVNHTDPISIQNQTGSNALTIGGSALSSTESGTSLTSGAVATASLLLSASNVTPGSRIRRNSATSSQSSSEEPRVVLVLFIGGCTFAEISALRFLTQQEENNCEFLIATTKIINGRSFIRSLWPLISPRAAPKNC